MVTARTRPVPWPSLLFFFLGLSVAGPASTEEALPAGARAWLGDETSRHRSAVVSLAFSRDGALLASGGCDTTVRLWDVRLGRPVVATPPQERRRAAETDEVYGVAIDPDGRWLVSVGREGVVRFWSIGDSSTELLRKRETRSSYALALSPDAKTLVTASLGDIVTAWNTETGEELWRTTPGEENRFYWEVAFSPDGSRVACVDTDGNVALRSAQSGEEEWRHPSRDGRLIGLGFSRDGSALVVADRFGTMELLDVDRGSSTDSVTIWAGRMGLWHFARSADGRFAAFTDSDRNLHIVDGRSGSPIGRVMGQEVQCICFSPDGRMLAAGTQPGHLLLWDMKGLCQWLARPQLEDRAPSLEECWEVLGVQDGRVANGAACRMAAAGADAVAFLDRRLPTVTYDEKMAPLWVAGLGDPDYTEREEASQRLRDVRGPADEVLRRALMAASDPEVKARLAEVIGTPIRPCLLHTAERLRRARAILALEWIGSDAAIEVLRRLSRGAPMTFETEEAELALERIAGSKD